MIVTRPINQNEPDLLSGNVSKVFNIFDLDGALVCTIEPPAGGWTHDKLEAIDCYALAPYGWDAYLQNDWIGSSEI